MKIQYFGGSSFGVVGKTAKIAMNATDDAMGKVDIATSSDSSEISIEAKKKLTLPGEYEVSGVLVRGQHTHDNKNVVFKCVIEDVEIVHFGDTPTIPMAKFFNELGENVDIAFFNLTANTEMKMVKDFLEKVDPRMVVFGGDKEAFPKAIEKLNAVVKAESEITISRASLPTDTTDYVILSV